MPSIVYLDGKWLPSDEAKVSVFDRGFLFGDGVYEVVMVYNRQPFRLEQHLTRLFRSLDQTGIPNPLGMHEWRFIIERLIDQNEGDQQSIYIQVTRGVTAQRSHTYPTGLVPTVFASSQSISLQKKDTRRNPPCSAITLEDLRWARGDIKSTSLLGSVLLKKMVAESGKDEGILYRDGIVTEGTASNVFIVEKQQIITPCVSDFLLTGITRDFIFELAARYQMVLLEEDISLSRLQEADEIWMSSSTAEIRAITELDGLPVGTGKIGPVWTRMAKLYQKHKSELFSTCA
ncbi:aminotransferase class IV [Litoribrevibacter albus]|uniref:Aminodeoxychorismate lyase n=1 Tax=Litoribrevibacter albus TaxID=1473156 RepID=A0AA37SCX4_9GAMM|nr:aminotransferase class IV [Litoribrevibacter albus]GLQ32450.1 D-amino acid aminotransferase [Litoribrevibacter albus]